MTGIPPGTKGPPGTQWVKPLAPGADPDDDIPTGYDQVIDPDDLEFVERANGADVFIKRLPPPAAPPTPQVSKEEAQSFGVHVGLTGFKPDPCSCWKKWMLALVIVVSFTGAGTMSVMRAWYGIDAPESKPRPHPCYEAVRVLLDADSPTRDYLTPAEIRLLESAIRAEKPIVDSESDPESNPKAPGRN